MMLNNTVSIENAYSCINVPSILIRSVPVIPIPNVPLAIFKEY